MLDDFDAVEIASQWHSVMTWNDPGVAMYSVTSTGMVHSEKHRADLLTYIDDHMAAAQKLDDDGESGVVMESNVADLEALQEWVAAYEIGEAS
jgi:hypothetical protein